MLTPPAKSEGTCPFTLAPHSLSASLAAASSFCAWVWLFFFTLLVPSMMCLISLSLTAWGPQRTKVKWPVKKQSRGASSSTTLHRIFFCEFLVLLSAKWNATLLPDKQKHVFNFVAGWIVTIRSTTFFLEFAANFKVCGKDKQSLPVQVSFFQLFSTKVCLMIPFSNTVCLVAIEGQQQVKQWKENPPLQTSHSHKSK